MTRDDKNNNYFNCAYNLLGQTYLCNATVIVKLYLPLTDIVRGSVKVE